MIHPAPLLCVIAALRETALQATLTGAVGAVRNCDKSSVTDNMNRLHRIRLSGIDAPEPQQALDSEARKVLSI